MKGGVWIQLAGVEVVKSQLDWEQILDRVKPARFDDELKRERETGTGNQAQACETGQVVVPVLQIWEEWGLAQQSHEEPCRPGVCFRSIRSTGGGGIVRDGEASGVGTEVMGLKREDQSYGWEGVVIQTPREGRRARTQNVWEPMLGVMELKGPLPCVFPLLET